ncbi:transcription initiation factor TFIIIB [Clostridium sp.]|uniref:transcription initiation factor TFIIIB n=1 Tax=Clostridium sp. TaxID=1506 RepID=UPI003F41450D
MEDSNKCPICGCEEIGKGKQYAQGSMFPINGIFKTGSQVIADICTKCGHILSMKVVNPEKFK